MKSIKQFISITALVLIFSCGDNSNHKDEMKAVTLKEEQSPTPQDDSIAGDDKIKQEKPPAPGKQDDRKKQPTTTQEPKIDWDKKIIKNASVNLEIKDYNGFYTAVREKIRSLGGYVAQEEQVQSDYKIENSMIIKVPVDQFDNALAQLTTNVVKINERKVTSQDVTTEVVDTKSRMETKKQVRQRYMELLNQARNMNDILSVQSEINGVQEQIEAAAGRIEYLNHASVFSTINLTYYQVLNSSAKEPADQKPASFGEKVKDAFRAGWDIVSNLFVVVVTLWPLLLASFFAYVLFKRMRGQKPKQASQ